MKNGQREREKGWWKEIKATNGDRKREGEGERRSGKVEKSKVSAIKKTGVGGKLRLRQQMDGTKERKRSRERGRGRSRKVNPPTVCGGDTQF